MPPHHVLRRNGRLQACEPCRISKNRCDHVTPVCNRCMARGHSQSCVYHPAPMTKSKAASLSSPAKLPRLLPEKAESPQTIEKLIPIQSFSSSTYRSSRATLFKRTGPTYDKTSFSAVFRENQAQIGAHLLDVEEEGPDARIHVYDDPVRMKLAVQTLRDFPTHQTCERLMVSFSTLKDPWLSPKMITHCLKSVETEFGDSLTDSIPVRGLSLMARELFKNGEHPPCPDDVEPWVNWFSGSLLRWEMIGILFSVFGFAMMHLQDWDPVFGLPEQRGQSRRSATHRMKECADACFSLRNTEHPTSNPVLFLLKNSSKLYSQIAGDECAELSLLMGSFVTLYVDIGLHRLPEHEEITPQSQFNRILAASGYHLEKSQALFLGKPPALSRFYCSFKLPLDLTDDEMYGSSDEEFTDAVSKLDKDGWNTSGHISTITYLRALCLIVPIREEILEISFGVNIEIPSGRIDQLLENLSVITTSSYPTWIQYRNINQWAHPSSLPKSAENFYLVTRIHSEVLQTKFLLERLKPSSPNRSNSRSLFKAAQELMAVVLSLWNDRDRLYVYHSAFHWMAVDYGIPSAGVLCVELLYSIRNPYATDTTNMSRTDTIQSLVMFVALLAWVRVGDGNYVLCQKLKNVIQKILDHVLEALVPLPLESGNTHSIGYGNIETDHLDSLGTDLSEEDWMSLLNTLDWTQGFGIETT